MPNRPRRPQGSSEVYSVTAVRASAAQDRHQREVRYLVAMAFRMICFAGALATTGWVRWTAVAVAVLMPWIAVVLANNRGTPVTSVRTDPGAPGGLGMAPSSGSGSHPAEAEGPVTGVVHLPQGRGPDSAVPTGAAEWNNG